MAESQETSLQFAGHVAELARAGLPLSSGLRALSEELPSRQLRRTLYAASVRLENGESVETVIDQSSQSLPDDLRVLLRAGLRSGRFAVLLEEYLTLVRQARDTRRQLMLGLIYPALLLLASGSLLVVLAVWVVPDIKGIFLGFDTELPSLTEGLLWISDIIIDWGASALLGFAALAVCAWIAARSLVGTAALRRLFCAIPVIGTSSRAISLGHFCHLLALLIDSELPLPDAIKIAGSGCGDSDLDQASQKLAQRVAMGASLQEAASSLPQFPSSLVRTFRWEGRQDVLPAALRAAAQGFEVRAESQSRLLPLIIEPVMVMSVGATFGLLVIALFMPLVKLLNDLS